MNNNHLTPTEWHLMECLWEKAPRSGRETVEYLSKAANWSRSTTLTMLRRMTQKGHVRCCEKDGMHVYFPVIRREDAVMQETDSFLKRVYHGSISMMVSALTKKQNLTQAEIDELYAILRKAEEANRDA